MTIKLNFSYLKGNNFIERLLYWQTLHYFCDIVVHELVDYNNNWWFIYRLVRLDIDNQLFQLLHLVSFPQRFLQSWDNFRDFKDIWPILVQCHISIPLIPPSFFISWFNCFTEIYSNTVNYNKFSNKNINFE